MIEIVVAACLTFAADVAADEVAVFLSVAFTIAPKL